MFTSRRLVPLIVALLAVAARAESLSGLNQQLRGTEIVGNSQKSGTQAILGAVNLDAGSVVTAKPSARTRWIDASLEAALLAEDPLLAATLETLLSPRRITGQNTPLRRVTSSRMGLRERLSAAMSACKKSAATTASKVLGGLENAYSYVTSLTSNYFEEDDAADSPVDWELVWSDEFNGSDGSAVNPAKWLFDVGGNGWGNNELQTYTDRRENAYVSGGALQIRVVKESFIGPDKIRRGFTSAKLLTKGKFTQAYGKFEARIQVPRGQGIWPAFWMLGENIGKVGWPKCGEIDIMENLGKEPSLVHGTFHGPGYSGGGGIAATYDLPDGRKFSDGFHTFAVVWEPNVIRFFVDGKCYKKRTPADLPHGTTWVYDHPFYMILNVAVGGSFPGDPDSSSIFPQTMKVDYVRVYQRATATASSHL